MIGVLLSLVAIAVTILSWTGYQAKHNQLEHTQYQNTEKTKQLQQQIDERQAKLDQIYTANESIFEEKEQSHHQEVQKFQASLDQKNLELELLQAQLASGDAKHQQQAETIELLTKEKLESESLVKKLTDENKKLESDYRYNLNSKIEELISARDLKITELEAHNQDLQATLDERTATFDVVVKKTEEQTLKFDSQMVAALKDLKSSQTLEEQTRVEVELLKSQAVELNQLRALKVQVDEVKGAISVEEIAEIESKVKELEEEILNQSRELDQKDTVIKTKSDTIEALTSQKQTLETEKAELSAISDGIQQKYDELLDQFKSQKHDFQLYDVVRYKYVDLYNSVKESIPELDEITCDEEDFEIVETLEAEKDKPEGEEEESKEEEKEDVKEEAKEEEESEKSEKSEEEPKTVLKLTGNEETKKISIVKHAVKQKIDELKQKIQDKQREANLIQNKLEASENDKSDLTNKHNHQVLEYKKLEEEMKLTRSLYDGSKGDVVDYKKQLTELKEELKQQTSKIKEITQLNQELNVQNVKIERARAIQDEKMINDDTVIKEQETEITELEKYIRRLEDRIEQLTNEVKEGEESIDQLTKDNKRLKSTLLTIHKESRLERERVAKETSELAKESDLESSQPEPEPLDMVLEPVEPV